MSPISPISYSMGKSANTVERGTVLNRTERDKSPYSEIVFHLERGGLLDFT